LSLNLLSVDGVQARHRVAAFAPALVAGDPSTSSLPTKSPKMIAPSRGCADATLSARFLKPPAAQNTADAKFGEGGRLVT
jgi:hypothetical protein